MTTARDNVIAAKLARVEGLAIGMQERLNDGLPLTRVGIARLIDAAQAVQDYAQQEAPDAR